MPNIDRLATPKLGLIGIQRAAFERASQLQNRFWLAQIALAVMTCITVFLDSYPEAVYVMTVLAFVGTVGLFYLSSLQRACRANAERARRASLLVWGLGNSIPAREYAEIRTSFLGNVNRARELADEKYFATKLALGYCRLGQMLEENAFWTSNLARASSGKIWKRFAVVCVLAVITLFAALGLGNKQVGIVSAKVVCAVLTLWISSDFLGAARSLQELSVAASDVDTRIQALKGQPDSVVAEHIFFIIGDYNSAVESSPMFVSSAFRKKMDKLNQLWKQRMRNSPVW
jgi:hypothetical protein